jgi:beta-N-acetylhexosaminidase
VKRKTAFFYVGILTTVLFFAPLNAATSKSELYRKAGQLMWVGYHNLKQLAEIKPAGVVLYGWNLENAREAKSAIEQIHEQETQMGLERSVVALDHEGGRVMRFKSGLSVVPDAAALAATQDPNIVEKISFLMARELKNIGVDINFAPVMDRGDAKSFLENRVWGDDPEKITQMTSAFLEGHLRGGTFPMPKHFPGHGRQALQDAHFLTPINSQSKAQLMQEDLLPFLHAMNDPRTPALMTAHVEMLAFGREPASISKKVLSDFLRRELGYNGFLLSDDLEMGGAGEGARSVDVAELAIKSLKSGVDSVLVVWSREDQLRVRDRIVAAMTTGELSEKLVDEKIAHVQMLKEKVQSTKELSSKNRSLSYDEKKMLVDQAWANSQSWILGNELSVRKLTASKNWTVIAPSGPYEKIWKTFRPHDRFVRVDFSKGDDAKALALLERKNREENPIALITFPLHRDGGEWVRNLTQFFNKNYNSATSNAPILWIHLGTQPVKVSKVEKPRKPFSLVLLNSTLPASLRHFMSVLSSEDPSWNSVSQNFSLYSQ